MERWPLAPEQIAINETLLEIDFGNYDEQAGLVYFGMIEHLQPQQHHLNAYGGELSYTLFYSTGLFGNALYGPDVILESQGKRIVHHSYAQPANAIPFVNTVRMIESQFQTISGGSVSREVFMQFLHQLDRIYIRATYQERTVVSRLGEVNLVIAEEDLSNQHLYAELPIERCACPPGYAGHSCESCADGFYRDPSGPYGGYCLPCQCNGHAETCDCNTGICQVRLCQSLQKKELVFDLLNVKVIVIYLYLFAFRTAKTLPTETTAKNALSDIMAMQPSERKTIA